MGDIIWLASYPKSGNTWLRAFLHNLLRNTHGPADINELDHFCLGESSAVWYEPYLSHPMEKADPEFLARIRAQVHVDMTRSFPDSVFVKTHNYLGEWLGQPLHNMDVTAGAIYVLRNPLDVVSSMTHHFGLTTQEAIERMAHAHTLTRPGPRHAPEYHASWSLHVKSWTQTPNPRLHVVRYEDLQAKPRAFFKKVVSFLGLKPPRERLERAIRNASFKSLRAQEEKKGFKERSEYARAFFREGKTAQWEKRLTPAQIRQIVSAHREQMERFGYVPEGY